MPRNTVLAQHRFYIPLSRVRDTLTDQFAIRVPIERTNRRRLALRGNEPVEAISVILTADRSRERPVPRARSPCSGCPVRSPPIDPILLPSFVVVVVVVAAIAASLVGRDARVQRPKDIDFQPTDCPPRVLPSLCYRSPRSFSLPPAPPPFSLPLSFSPSSSFTRSLAHPFARSLFFSVAELSFLSEPLRS